jgi:hypothetical protein
MSRNTLKIIIKLVLALVFLIVIIVAKETTSRLNLGFMLLGLAGLLGLLYDYNRKYS